MKNTNSKNEKAPKRISFTRRLLATRYSLLAGNRRGQFLVEAIVASSVLIIGFMGVMGLLSQSFRLNRIATDNYRGTYLAAEGIEIVKNMIDHNTVTNIACAQANGGSCPSLVAWDTLPGSNPGNPQYRVDYASTQLTIGGVGQPLRFDPATNLYGYSVGSATNFRRTIRIRHFAPTPLATSTLMVSSIVTWSTGLFQSRAEMDDTFYNWFPIP